MKKKKYIKVILETVLWLFAANWPLAASFSKPKWFLAIIGIFDVIIILWMLLQCHWIHRDHHEE